MISKIRVLLTTALLACSTVASATVVSYSGTEDGTLFSISFDDNTAGVINVIVTSTPDGLNGTEADLFGLAFDWTGTPVPTYPSSFNFVSSSTTTGFTGERISNVCYGPNISSCGGAVNFNGTGETFDFIMVMGDNGTQNGFLNYFNFSITTSLSLAQTLGDDFGIRAQSSGSEGEDSVKLVTFVRDDPEQPPQEIPEPASLALMGFGLLALAASRRRKG